MACSSFGVWESLRHALDTRKNRAMAKLKGCPRRALSTVSPLMVWFMSIPNESVIEMDVNVGKIVLVSGLHPVRVAAQHKACELPQSVLGLADFLLRSFRQSGR